MTICKRSYDEISNTGDDPFLHSYPYPIEVFDNYITNLNNLYNLKDYYLHKDETINYNNHTKYCPNLRMFNHHNPYKDCDNEYFKRIQ
jgi:hypothetical protein